MNRLTNAAKYAVVIMLLIVTVSMMSGCKKNNTDVSSKLNKSDIKTSDDNVLTVNSPLVGVFYSSASPEADAYVAIGDRVKKGQVIGIVEAMKLMNEIESDYDGVVTDILVDNEQMVEYGQPMFVIKPV